MHFFLLGRQRTTSDPCSEGQTVQLTVFLFFGLFFFLPASGDFLNRPPLFWNIKIMLGLFVFFLVGGQGVISVVYVFKAPLTQRF